MKKYFFLLSLVMSFFQANAATQSYDIVIYGGTSAGVIAAIQASHLGKSVVLIHSGKHVGGATINGLGIADSNRHDISGGLTKEFFYLIWHYYQNDAAWKFEAKHPIRDQKGNPDTDEKTMWVYEPHVAEKVFKAMLKSAQVPVVLDEKLNLINGVQKSGQQIVQIQMESGNSYQGKVFIDATYEGDLMAGAQVSYTTGRESNLLYGETFNGVQLNLDRSHSTLPIDPYVIKGDPKSGFLPRIYPNAGGNEGEADCGIQAYTFRMCLTNVPENRIFIEKPLNYDESQYEILFRAIESGMHKFLKINLVPNLKADCNNLGLVSTDYVGMSWTWAEANHETRQKIAYEHQKWQEGLLWTLQNHPRVPLSIKRFYSSWGLPKDEFIENNHWPYELYVREARRMVSSTVMTENTVLGKQAINDGVALAFYHIDCHNVKYYMNSNQEMAQEGGLSIKIPAPFLISYQALVPKKDECQNLIVPVCSSASHVGYASIRMEPTYMVLGQAAATAAALAINLTSSVQDVPYDLLRSQLLNDGQVLDTPLSQ